MLSKSKPVHRGVTATLSAAEEGERSTGNEGRVVRRLMPYLWPRGRADLKRRVAFAIVALVLAKAATVAVPFFYKWAVDVMAPTQGGGGSAAMAVAAVAISLTLGYGLVRLMSNGFQQLRDALFAHVGQFAQRAVTVETFAHMHDLSLRFHLERRTGGLSRIVERGTRAIDFLLRFTLFNIIPTLIELVLVAIILTVKFNVLYAIVTAATVIAYVWFTFVVTGWRIKLRREMNDRDTEANTKAIDSLLNFETVKYFTNEGYETRRFERAAKAYEGAAVKTQVSLTLLNFGQSFVFSLGMVILMVMAAMGVAGGQMTLGDYVLINTFLLQLAVPLNMLGFVYREIKQSLIDMERMFDILDVAPEVTDVPDARPLAVRNATITFEDVRFSYDPEREILHGVSFEVPGGRTLAIVGPSGAGKSTISRLLFRFYDATAGQILIDGQDIRQVTQASLRAAIGIVPQDTVLFNDTIGYNIRYGRPDADEEEIVAAAKAAEIHDFVMSLPAGYDTLVGERGLKLSGGEKQRVAIARTILKDPPILLLDEATSALDSHTEKAIQASLKRVARDRTTIIIAHRLSTVVDADEILVLEQGRVVERGAHADLIARDGAYAALWARQMATGEIGLADAQAAE